MPPRKTPAVPPARFATSFVGRERLFAAVERSLAEHRLVTLLGPPGVGKSRLAAEGAARAPGRGVWCDLQGVATADDVAARLADATGARLLGDRDAMVEALGAAVRGRIDRVVLDEAEGAAAELAAFLPELLEAAPRLRVLVTSRVRLGVPGEALVDVPPLDLSPGGEAEQLFVERARRVRHDLAPGAAGLGDVLALVRSLDGLPLAIELAAARSRFVPIGALVERTLSPARSGGEASLWEAIERSVEELPESTQKVFCKLAVFRGGFLLEAAEAVVAGTEGVTAEADARSGDVLGVLSELADRSLLGTAHVAGAPRFTMLNAVRAVAESRADRASWPGVRARHAGWFAEVAERGTREDAEDPAALRRELGRDRENLAAALEWARAERAPERLILATAWAVLHEGVGPLAALYSQLADALEQARGVALAARARAVAVLAGIARELDLCADVLPAVSAIAAEARGRAGAAGLFAAGPVAPGALATGTLATGALATGALATGALATDTFPTGALATGTLATGMSPTGATATAMSATGMLPAGTLGEAEREVLAALSVAEAALGQSLTALGRFEEGARALVLAREVERRLRRPAREARVVHAFGVNRVEAGRLGEARLALREALSLLDGRDAAQEARTLTVLGVIELEEGRLAEARACLDRALPIAQEQDDRRLLALATTNHAAVAHEGGDLDAAAREKQRAGALCAGEGLRRGEALARAFVGHCRFERGQFGAARAAYEEALARLAKEGWRHTMVLAPYGAAIAMEGDEERGARAMDEAEATLRAMGQERLALAVQVWRGFVALAEADRLRAQGDEAGAARRVEAARERARGVQVDPTPRPEGVGGPALAQQSTDVRVALRALGRAVSERTAAGAKIAAWEVRPDGSLIVGPSGERCDLGRRAALRRIALRLATERVERPGEVVSVEELVRAGWPGEEVPAKGGADRVYVAIATLRKLGLAAVLQSTGDGYRLDPSVPVRVTGARRG